MAKPNPYSDEEIKELKRGRGISPLGIITTNRFLDTIAELKSTVEYWDKVSERRYSVYAKLGRIWAKVVGKEGTIPDTGKLLDWLAEYIECLETALEGLEKEGDIIARLIKSVPTYGGYGQLKLHVNGIACNARRAREGGKKVDRKAD